MVERILRFEENLENKRKDWKTKLTGGLDSTEVFISLSVLSCFYAIYTLINYRLGNSRDQYTIINGCHCSDDARKPYRWSFYTLLSLWLIVHTYIFIERNLKDLEFSVCCCTRCLNCWKCIQNCIQKLGLFFIAFRHFIWASICECINSCFNRFLINDDSDDKQKSSQSSSQSDDKPSQSLSQSDDKPSQSLSQSDDKPSQSLSQSDDKSSQSSSQSDNKPSQSSSQSADKSSQSDDKSSQSLSQSDDKSSHSSSQSDDKSSQSADKSSQSDDKSSQSLSQSDDKSSQSLSQSADKSTSPSDNGSKSSSSDEDRENLNLKHYKDILWYRYYKLYVVGYSKDIKPDKKLPKSEHVNKGKDPESKSQYFCWKSCQSCIDNNEKSCCPQIIRKLIRTVLVLLKYIAQGATVPLLMLQVFDTYAYLCFSRNDAYCKAVSEYEVHLAQVAITISFYFCIALAQLTNEFLDWDQNREVVKKKDNA